MKLKEKIFYDEENPDWLRTFVYVIIVWYIIDVVIFYLLGFLNILNVLAATNLLILLILTNYIFGNFRAKQQENRSLKFLYLPIVFVIALIEETIVYYSGGGLQGAAVSLWHDLALSIPVFLMIGVGILITNRIRKMNSGEIFLLGYICGTILEIILPVHFFNPVLVLLFGGAGAGFYSILYTAFAPINEISPERLERKKVHTMKILLIGTIICFFCMIIGGIIGSTLYAMTSV